MDQNTLVEEQIDDGQRLISLLTADGFHIAAAAWVKPTEDSSWQLYIVSREVDDKGLGVAYQSLHPALQQLGQAWDMVSSIRLISPANPIAQDILDIQKRYPGRSPTRSRRARLGNMPVDETYVYPPPVRPEEKWRAISIMVFPESDSPDVYRVEFWPNALQAATVPGGQPRRVLRPASVRVQRGKVVDSSPPEKPLPHLEQTDYEAKAIEAVGQVALQSA